MARGTRELHPHVLALLDDTDESDPFMAVRLATRRLISEFSSALSVTPPFHLEMLASFRGLKPSAEAPRFSPDSEIAPEEDGRVVLRVNRDRPLTRQRFSIGHEVGHTLFPGYHLAVRCRKPSDRVWADPNDLLETLCDVAASEILFPHPWFDDYAQNISLSAVALGRSAVDYEASREATLRRIVEVRKDPLAVVFFSWKLKPTEERLLARDRRQQSLFPSGRPAPLPMLRVDYAIINDAFSQQYASHIPKDKSVPSEGPIYQASVTQTLQDGDQRLDIGTLHHQFTVHALPIFTSEDATGPTGGCSVAAVLKPT